MTENLNTQTGRDELYNRLLSEAIEEADQKRWWKMSRAKKIDLLVDVAEDYYRVAAELDKHKVLYEKAAGDLDLRYVGIDRIPEGMTVGQIGENRDYMLQQADSYRRSARKYRRLARWTLRRVAWLSFLERVVNRD